jgi:hypothetical protein
MAITNNGTTVNLPLNQVPSDYTYPTVTTFTDHEYSRTLTLNVLKSTVENADEATTLGAIITNASIGITKQVDDILAADYLATATVTAYADWVGLAHNIAPNDSSDFLNNTAVSYVCTVNLYVKTA